MSAVGGLLTGVAGTAGINAVAAGSATRSAPAGETRPGLAREERSCPVAEARLEAAGETGAAGEPVGRGGLAASWGMNAVGESATGGVVGPDGTGRLGVPGVVGRVGISPGVPGLVGAPPGVPGPPAGPRPGAALPGQGGGASTLGGPGVWVGSGRPVLGRAGCSGRGGCSVRPGGGTAARSF
ncbi:hypothetical protein [Micromonospora sp. NBC_01638]|uniref:hypothetical protein n=1 Tax=Micromonospora sp. NBC_01638 TaxID=2975982 RepID=UPI003865CBE7